MAPAQAPTGQRLETKQLRDWRGVNQVDARTAMPDDELFWMENAITIGKGAIQILPKQGTAVATIAAGVAAFFGFTLNGAAVFLTINTDGSLSQVTPGGVVTAVAPAGTVTTAARCTIWQSSPILIIDPVKGYFAWDGTTFTTISASQLGVAIAVFEGRVWIAQTRTLTYTAPSSYTDFTAANGAGATIITDDAFQGSVVNLYSALEQLWIVGQSAINALSNVQASGTAPNVVTTFSNTNIVTNLGTNAPASVIAYFRALTLLAPFGAYALSGVTPQKISDKLDGLFPSLTLTPDVPAAIAVVQSLPCLVYLATYTGTLARAGSAPIKLLLVFTQGKWSFAVQGSALAWITTVVHNGVSEAWGTDGSTIYQLFGGGASAAVVYKVMTKLSDFGGGGWPYDKAATQAGIMYQAATAVTPTMTLDSEKGSEVIAVTLGNTITWVNAANAAIQFRNAALADLFWFAQGTVLSMSRASLHGHFLGFTLYGEDRPFRIEAFAVEFDRGKEWSNP